MESIPFGTMISYSKFSVSPLAFFSRYFFSNYFQAPAISIFERLAESLFQFLFSLVRSSSRSALGRKLWEFEIATSWSQMARSEQMEIHTTACSSGAVVSTDAWGHHTPGTLARVVCGGGGGCVSTYQGREKCRDLGPCVHTSASVPCWRRVFLFALAAWNWTDHVELAKPLWMILTMDLIETARKTHAAIWMLCNCGILYYCSHLIQD